MPKHGNLGRANTITPYFPTLSLSGAAQIKQLCLPFLRLPLLLLSLLRSKTRRQFLPHFFGRERPWETEEWRTGLPTLLVFVI